MARGSLFCSWLRTDPWMLGKLCLKMFTRIFKLVHEMLEFSILAHPCWSFDLLCQINSLVSSKIRPWNLDFVQISPFSLFQKHHGGHSNIPDNEQKGLQVAIMETPGNEVQLATFLRKTSFKVCLIRPVQPPVTTISKNFYVKGPVDLYCHCDGHLYNPQMNRYLKLAKKELMLHEELEDLHKDVTIWIT